jgi:hypothetical protein
MAILHLIFQEQLTPLFKESALFISGTAAGAIRHSGSPAFYIVLQSKVAAANGAVHTARGN